MSPQSAHRRDTSRGSVAYSSQSQIPTSSQSRPTNESSNDSQATTVSNDVDCVFSPPGSDSEGSTRPENGLGSSQDSQLLQLSQLAAAQSKMTEVDDGDANTAASRKRMADGVVKHRREGSNVSPVRMGHSRNTSTVSMASTAGSRIGELSAELRTKLSYAMVKVNNGWQSHSIDEVESLASQAASPTSSTSTLPGRHGTSASPRIPLTAPRYVASTSSSTVTSPTLQPSLQDRSYDAFRRENHAGSPNPTSPISQVPTLAPAASIRPRQSTYTNPRRNSNVKYAPAYLSHSHNASPHTPAQPSPLQSTPGTRGMQTPNIDPILFSPHQNVREQEALETLMFMSSPGNSANLKHTFPSSQNPQPRTGSTRTALPTSRLAPAPESNRQARKSLPTGKPQQVAASAPKRVGFEKSGIPSNNDMDIDTHYGSPQQNRGTPRRKANSAAPPSRPALTVPAGLSGPSRPRNTLREDDIERMLERVADNSSDSEGEIRLPQNNRRNRTGVGA